MLVNTPAETAFAREVAVELVGPERVIAPVPPLTGSEDFAFMLERSRAATCGWATARAARMVHNPGYDFNDEILTVGAEYWTRLVERYLGE